jgi:hypothetical protein
MKKTVYCIPRSILAEVMLKDYPRTLLHKATVYRRSSTKPPSLRQVGRMVVEDHLVMGLLFAMILLNPRLESYYLGLVSIMSLA